jgi:hypothetical protein
VAFASAIVVAAAGTICAIIIVRQQWRRHDAVAHPSGWREHAVIREHHASRPRHQRAEAFEEGERIEDDVRGAVAIPLKWLRSGQDDRHRGHQLCSATHTTS